MRYVAEPTQPFGGPRDRRSPRWDISGFSTGSETKAAGQFFRWKNRNFKRSFRGPIDPASGLQRETDAGTMERSSEKAIVMFTRQLPAIPLSKHRLPSLLKDVVFAALRWVLL